MELHHMFDRDYAHKNALMTEVEVAQHLKLAINTLQNWRSQDPSRGPAFVKLGRAVRYRLEDVEAYIRCGRQSGVEEAGAAPSKQKGAR